MKENQDPCNSSSCQPADHEDLLAQGWERRFVGDQRMVTESVEMYEQMGWDVRVVPLKTEGIQEGCMGCMAVLQDFSAVYIRRKTEE